MCRNFCSAPLSDPWPPLVVFVFRFSFAILDWVVTFIELAGIITYSIFCTTWVAPEEMFHNISLACQLAIILLSLIFRTVAIAVTKKSRYHQPFKLLGGCTRVPYTPVQIIFGRSVVRPLVRGEFPAIAFFRGLILAVLCIGFPAFSIYTAIVIPLQSQVLIRNVKYDEFSLNPPPILILNATITVLNHERSVPVNTISVSGNTAGKTVPVSCKTAAFPYYQVYRPASIFRIFGETAALE
ncbi:hypothetical protein C8J57DRAFT_521445 [Mycena rebaudengoi]|nr:hypothetical protein C8J57DRAFT_521445 [Mycena rebaudengoi]